MSERTIVIVGGVAGGMSAATRLRRLDEQAHIIVFERGEHVSFANCGLPYYVGGVIEDRQALLLQTPESLRKRFNLEVRVRHEVVEIAPHTKSVRVKNLTTGECFDQAYDELLLAPGASPFVPPTPGIERGLTLRDVTDVDRLSAAVEGARSAVIIGAGFIGLEVAENLLTRGLQVAVVELAPQVLAPLDPELAVLVADRLCERGVDLRLGRQVASVGMTSVTLDDGSELAADVLITAIGVRPETSLAKSAGLELGPRGGIAVDEHLRTSVPHIWAVGDAVEKRDALDADPALVPLANPANRQGRIVADAICGREVRDTPVLGTAIVGVLGLQAGVVGWNEKRLKAAGKDYVAIHTHPQDHAGYYPGAQPLHLKLLMEPGTGRILGAQGVGASGVDKRIDVIATAMRGGLSAPELMDLELCYAPQFGSAKDPVNMLGYIAENLVSGTTETVQWYEIADLDAALIDVRTPGEYARGAIPGAVNIPVDELRDRLAEVGDDVVVHCAVGVRGHIAARLLANSGKRARNLSGGYQTWSAGQRVQVGR